MKKIFNLVIAALVIAIVYLLFPFNKSANSETTESNDARSIKSQSSIALLTHDEIIKKIMSIEPKAKDAFVTDAKVLYISVNDDGTKRDGLASYFCDRMKEYNSDIVRVKIIKVGSQNDSDRDNSYGVKLGECWCK